MERANYYIHMFYLLFKELPPGKRKGCRARRFFLIRKLSEEVETVMTKPFLPVNFFVLQYFTGKFN